MKSFKLFMAVVIICMMSFISISILTYNKLDPSALNATGTLDVHNFFGNYGANISDIMLQTFGYSIILPIVFFFIFAVKILNNLPNKFFIYRTIGILFATLILAIIFSLISINSIVFNIGYGGFIGDYLKQLLLIHIKKDILLFSLIGALIVISIICLGLTFSEWRSIFKCIAFSIRVLFKCIKFAIAKLSSQRKKFDEEAFNENMVKADNPIMNKKPEIVKKIDNNDDKLTLPSVEILDKISEHSSSRNSSNNERVKENSESLKKVLKDYGIKGEMLNYSVGPVVTLFELEPAAGTKASRVIGLSDDIARSMSAVSTRIAVIPGKNALGIEIPNDKREIIYLRELIESREYKNNNYKLPLVLGKSISGAPVITDLAKMPHLLVAGTTGSGKSVAINTMILSLLYSCTVKQCRLVMIDPKMLELSVYDGIPHLLSPVVTEAKKAVGALKWVVQEMERRYRAMASLGVRNIMGFNELLLQANKKGTTLKKVIQTGFDPETGEPTFEEVDLGNEQLPYIVVIVDEMADLMLVAGKEIEGYIQRIAQMARASGIHLIMATQRPSVDVITGVIKANFPTRISFHVTSRIDSRTILGEQGAEQLLGMGDMLYMMPGGHITRVHGPFVSDLEVENVVKQLKKNSSGDYDVDFNSLIITDNNSLDGGANSVFEDKDGGDLYQQAIKIVIDEKRPTTSYIQRRLKIGYNKAASLIEQMENDGIISPANSQGKREILRNK
ncbi:MAG: DNA translocase FtsK 4TM domain-containing protein [Rickettsiales bacterium]|nr:DNA translocase FtsK 4TM domain-containing protein [Rickettsiales bacterium]